jgi:RNA polymerase sigma-70 factor (ECF subfamily)
MLGTVGYACRKKPTSDRSAKRFLNKSLLRVVFMDEANRLAMGEATLSEAAKPNHVADELVEELVLQHSRLVYRIAYAALRSHDEAEDATQETFLRVLRYSRKLAKVENPKAWLSRIAWRVAVERSRRRGGRREVAIDDPEKPTETIDCWGSTPNEAMRGYEIGDQLDRLIAALPQKLRQPLILSALEEMSPREVAAALGINEASVRSRVFRARQILREKLAARAGRK